MEWVKLFTTFHDDPKVLAAGTAATGLYAKSLSFAGAQETDGFVPREFVSRSEVGLAARLVKVGLWEPAKGGWRIHGWLGRQRSHKEMKRVRAALVERQRRHRRRSETPPVTRDTDVTPASRVTDALVTRDLSSSLLSSSLVSSSTNPPIGSKRNYRTGDPAGMIGDGRKVWPRTDEDMRALEEMREQEAWLTQAVLPAGMTEAQARAKYGEPLPMAEDLGGEKARAGT